MSFARTLLALAFLTWTAAASAQTDDVHAAAAAFEEGQRAQLRGDFAQAADLFEIADRSAPNPAALRSAIRNHRAASHPARAATLAAEAQARYPEDAETSALAAETITALAPTLGHVSVRCDVACSVTLDGRAAVEHAIEAYELFVEPGEHTLVASWHGGGSEHRSVDAHAGEALTVELAPPVVATVSEGGSESERESGSASGSEGGSESPSPRAQSSGLHPAIFGTLAGLAVAGLAITIWSGIDTLNGAADYRNDPTRARYDDGIGRELRTNVLTSVTAALAVAALVTVFFTDWDDIAPGPDDTITLRPSFYASSDGGGAMLFGRYAP